VLSPRIDVAWCEVIASWPWSLIRSSGNYGKSIWSRITLKLIKGALTC
jgi:hypothetical protein